MKMFSIPVASGPLGECFQQGVPTMHIRLRPNNKTTTHGYSIRWVHSHSDIRFLLQIMFDSKTFFTHTIRTSGHGFLTGSRVTNKFLSKIF
jgi:hypothetical protein